MELRVQLVDVGQRTSGCTTSVEALVAAKQLFEQSQFEDVDQLTVHKRMEGRRLLIKISSKKKEDSTRREQVVQGGKG